MRLGLSLAISQPRGGGTGGAAATPFSLVATRARFPNTRVTANKQGNSRTAHVAKDTITSLKCVWANAYAGTFLATPAGDSTIGSASATITASVEYPSGTFTQITFSGSATGTIADLGILESDACTVSIPSGSTFWIRSFWNSTAGVCYTNGPRDSTAGDLYRVAASGLTDLTLGGTITHNAGTGAFFPAAIVAQTSIDSYVICGDSIAAGYKHGSDPGTAEPTLDGVRGVIAPSIPSSKPFINIGQSGEKASNFLTNGAVRKLLIPYAKHIITEYGRNDKDLDGASDATLRTNILAIWALAASGAKKYQATLTPESSSTDSWATAGNQTAVNNEATFNTLVRAGTGFTGMTGYIDVAALTNPNGDGKWLVTPTPPYTYDGLHPSVALQALCSGVTWTTF